jgi:uncharacterized lipoprotein YajG
MLMRLSGMFKKFFIILSVILLVALAGCSSDKTTVTSAPAANVKQLRQMEIAGKWAVKQG